MLPPQSEDPSTKHKRINIAYRPPKERPALNFCLNFCLVEWLKSEHAIDPLQAVQPICFILSNTQCAILVHTQAKKIKSTSDIQTIHNESNEWASKWGDNIFNVIQQYDRDLAALNFQDKENKTIQSKRLKK